MTNDKAPPREQEFPEQKPSAQEEPRAQRAEAKDVSRLPRQAAPGRHAAAGRKPLFRN
jgi:hypothetical protein